MERLHIIDGYGYIFRAFYGLVGSADRRGVRLTTSAGMPTGALYVYAQMLIRLHLDVKPQRVVVVFDAPGKTFRNELDSDYKANRADTPDDLQVQMPYFRPLTEAFCWPVLAVGGVEADDVIATLTHRAREQGWDVTIFSGDKDLMQLVDDHVVVIDSMRDITYDHARVTEKFGVPPAQVSDWLALVGDKSDNVPGMAGVGKVTAAKLLGEHGSIDGILAHVEQLKGKQKERFQDPALVAQLLRSRELVSLKDDVELPVALEALVPAPWEGTELARIFRELEFQALLARLDPGAAAEPGDAGVEQPEALPDSTVILDADSLLAFTEAARRAGRLAIAVETDDARHDRARLIGMGLATDEAPPAYLPLEHRYLSAPRQLVTAELPEPLRALLADPAIGIVSHDVKAATHVLADAGLPLAGVIGDLALADYLIDANRDASNRERIIAEATGLHLTSKKKLLGKGKNAIGYEAVPVEDAARYAGSAAAAMLRAHDVLARRLERAQQEGLYRELELPLAVLLGRIERVGVTLDVAHLRAVSERVGGQIAALETRIHELAGTEINVGSPKQLAALLFDRLGLTSGKMKKTKTGYSTDHEVLESLIDAHEIVAPIIEHRELVKLKGTYIDALPPLINPRTGRLHTTFAQAVAATGRLSSQDPNLQNIPVRTELGREIRRAFVAAEGKLLVSLDYSQIELRIMAHLSGDPVLTEAFRSGIDVHTQTAAEVFGIPRDEVGDHERRVAKAVNYGLIYGQSGFGLARALSIPRSEAQHYIDRYFERFSTVRQFMDDLVARARATGAATTVLGRRRLVPDLTSKSVPRRRAGERIAQNTPIQGSAADLLKMAMLKVDARLQAEGSAAQMLLTVHDELVFEVDTGEAEALAARVKAEMEAVYPLSVPLVVDVGIGPNWADAH